MRGKFSLFGIVVIVHLLLSCIVSAAETLAWYDISLFATIPDSVLELIRVIYLLPLRWAEISSLVSPKAFDSMAEYLLNTACNILLQIGNAFTLGFLLSLTVRSGRAKPRT